jgi:hypothetical protein
MTTALKGCLLISYRAHVSGGTMASVIGFIDHFSLSELIAASKPYALSPIPGPLSSSSGSILSKIFGVRHVPGLGLLTTAIQAASDVPIVHRSWGLFGGAKLYGPNFYYEERSRTKNILTGLAVHLGTNLATFLFILSPLRWFVKYFVPAPGDGPTPETTKGDFVEYRGIATPDVPTKRPKAFCQARYLGSMYECRT